MPIDSTPRRPHRSRRPKGESGEGIRKRTPLEQAIAEKKDRRARYDAHMREAGFKRTTIWVREEALEHLQAVVRIINGAEGDLDKALDELSARRAEA